MTHKARKISVAAATNSGAAVTVLRVIEDDDGSAARGRVAVKRGDLTSAPPPHWGAATADAKGH